MKPTGLWLQWVQRSSIVASPKLVVCKDGGLGGGAGRFLDVPGNIQIQRHIILDSFIRAFFEQTSSNDLPVKTVQGRNVRLWQTVYKNETET